MSLSHKRFEIKISPKLNKEVWKIKIKIFKISVTIQSIQHKMNELALVKKTYYHLICITFDKSDYCIWVEKRNARSKISFSQKFHRFFISKSSFVLLDLFRFQSLSGKHIQMIIKHVVGLVSDVKLYKNLNKIDWTTKDKWFSLLVSCCKSRILGFIIIDLRCLTFHSPATKDNKKDHLIS